MTQPIIAPSILSADFGNLQRDTEMLNRSQAGWIHVDIMDGIFVPNISFGFPVLQSLKKASQKPLDVHLMIANPEPYIERFAEHGASNLTVHIELGKQVPFLLEKIKIKGMKAGVAISPDTPVDALSAIIHEVDLVCVMSVYPGFGGQKFIENTFQKLSSLRELISKSNSNALIEVDGGVTLQNAPALIRAGVQVLVAGNTVFAQPNPEQVIIDLMNH